jgi:hypothetical protein
MKMPVFMLLKKFHLKFDPGKNIFFNFGFFFFYFFFFFFFIFAASAPSPAPPPLALVLDSPAPPPALSDDPVAPPAILRWSARTFLHIVLWPPPFFQCALWQTTEQ